MKKYLIKINNFFRKKFDVGFSCSYPFRTSTNFARDNLSNCKDLICVEIGTWEGENALEILKNLPNIKMLYLIDPWEKYNGYKEDKNNKQKLDCALDKTKKRLKKYKNKVKIIRKYSDDAVGNLPDEIDFIYIDGNHDYEFIKKDIENYYKKLKIGGVLAGHDIETCPGVTKAFCEFIVENKLDPIIARMDWIVVKK